VGSFRFSRGARVAAAFALAGALVACSSGAKPNTNAGKGQGPVKDPTKPVTVTFSSWVGGDPTMKKFAADFHKLHPNITIQFQNVNADNASEKLTTQIAGGNPPDVAFVDASATSDFASRGALVNLDNYIARSDVVKPDDYVDAFKTFVTYQGHLWGLPIDGESTGLFYRTDLFKAAGISGPPTTWDEFMQDVQKLTDPAKKQYGFSLAAGSYTENVHFAFINGSQNGGSWFDSAGKPTFTSDQNVQGVLRYLDLMQKDKVVNTSNAQYDNGTKSVNDFATKKVAMILNQNNADNSIVANGMKSDEYGVVPFPSPTGGQKIATFIAGINMSIFKNTKNKDAALQFVKFMTSPETQKTLGKPFSSLPVLKGETPVFTDNAEEAKTFANIYANMSKPLPLVPGEDQFESTVGKAMNSMFAKIATGGTVSADDVKAALKDAQDQVAAAS
jgi:multiple sugar transport system substrate-binding protein